MRGYLNNETKELTPINQIAAEAAGLPDYEVEAAYNGRLYLKGYAPEEPEEEKRKKLNLLSLTKREVFLALYKAKGITPEMVRGSITDETALIEFDYATEYYRGNPLIDAIGEQLGYNSDDLDYLFLNKELPEAEPEPETEPKVEADEVPEASEDEAE